MSSTVLAIALCFLVIVFLVGLRAKMGPRYELKSSDIVLAMIPIALWLLLTGKVQEFAFGDFKIVAAFRDASQTQLTLQITKIPIENDHVEPKGGVEALPCLLTNKTQALGFTVGYGSFYYGPAIEEYFRTL
jgi:hypothetical protein